MRDHSYIKPMEWGYPIEYDKESEYQYDVIVFGGGLGGIHAAIAAAKKGSKVAVLDKGPVIRSGSGGTGVDHWHSVHTNPASKVTPDDAVEIYMKMPWFGEKFCMGHTRYIECMESWETLMDLEKLGVPIRDMDDEFAGAPFRDEKTKLMYAYDYEKKTVIRLRGGALMKPLLKAEAERVGVDIFDFISVVGLLTEGGKQGTRVIGVAAVHFRTGKFYIFKAKAVVMATGRPTGLWNQFYEMNGSAARFWDPNCVGDGQMMAYKAGADVTLMEMSTRVLTAGPFGWHPYSVGNTSNTWVGARMVDANGTLIEYVGPDGKNTIPYEEVNYNTSGVGHIEGMLDRDVVRKIKSGELKLPFYIDFPGMTPHERRALWGLMVGNEGKTNLGVYKAYQAWGFDPDKDMMQVPVFPPDVYSAHLMWNQYLITPIQLRELNNSGSSVVTDWQLKATVDGLYGCGYMLGNNYAAGACTCGRYAGRNAAEYAKTIDNCAVERKQVDEIKQRLYAPATRKDGIGWKEFKQGLARIMQDNVGEQKSKSVLEHALNMLQSVKEGEFEELYARNPHELVRVHECYTSMVLAEMVIRASLAREASNTFLNFSRYDFPEVNQPEWDKYITVKELDGKPVIGELPLRYFLKGQYSGDWAENYHKYKAKG